MKEKLKLDICVQCGRPEGEHHDFIGVVKPIECICDPLEWNDPTDVPDICTKYIGNGMTSCDTCEHDKECHENQKH